MATILERPAEDAGAADPPAPAVTPWYVHAVVFSSLCVLVGVIWDISWHQSIGRDTLFSPPHLAIYLGGIVAGLSCGWVVLRLSFAGGSAGQAGTVTFWRWFRGPLGAWVCIWGAIAMITSAPFDDWWHNAYGLDTKILSPPHAVLASGILAIGLGALLLVAPLQNRAADAAAQRRLAWLQAVALGLVLLMVGTMVSEYHYRIFMHGSEFYRVAAIAFPVVLAAAGRSLRLRWPATAAALVYSGVTLVMMWVLPLFPAEPKLAPVNLPVTNMVPPSFPLLLVAPALVIDVLLRHVDARPAAVGRWLHDWGVALGIGIIFVVAFAAVQMPFAVFLMSDAAQNGLFAANNFPYQVSPGSAYYRRVFVPQDATEAAWRAGLVRAMAFAVLSARLGLAWGGWLRRVQR
jgi:hypothetical protein